MEFYDINCIKPMDGEIILAKLEPSWDYSINYYVFTTYIINDKYLFVESSGGEFWTVELSNIVGWMPLKKLDDVKLSTKI